jgi:predicted nucleotidyltransferase
LVFPLADSLVATVLDRMPGLADVYLFGSQAREDAGPGSDIDLAVLTLGDLDPVDRWKLQEDLAAQAHQNVDLVDLRRASTVMRVQVLRDGRLLADVQPLVRAAFEATALSAYARLNEERRGILNDIAARGRVYG